MLCDGGRALTDDCSLIQATNHKQLTYKVGVNKFADFSVRQS